MTRCDFYLGRGPLAIWVGSIGHDAWPDALQPYFSRATTEETFQAGLAQVFKAYGEIPVKAGWPWPWEDSRTTDVAIAFDEGQVWVTHHSDCWAPLADSDTPTETPCVFPNMVTAEEATADGRLRRRFRLTANLPIGATDDPMVAALLHVAMRLARLWLHSYEQEGAFWLGTESQPSHHAMFDFSRAFQLGGEDFESALEQRIRDHSGWALLTWVRDTSAYFEVESVRRPLDAEQPLYFAQPCPESIRVSEGAVTIHCAKVLDTEKMKEARELLDSVVDTVPACFARAVQRELCDMGSVRRQEAEEWFERAQDGLGGRTLTEACATREGREEVRRFAATLYWGDR